MPATSPGAAVPVETLLKLTLDKAGAKSIEDFMASHEKSWGHVEQHIGRIGSHLEGIGRRMEGFGRGVLGLAGIAGVGAVAQNFMQVSQAGSNVALAGGQVTGGPGTWHPYGQAMLGAQRQTGVPAPEIATGLIQALQAVGGTPTPYQASVLGGLIAGYGQTVGLSPSQVAQVVSPLLQASNRPLTQANILGVGATLSGGLSAFPGSQAAPMLGLLSQLGVSQALGVGPHGGFTPNMHGLTAAVNAAAQSNSIFRNPHITGGAINSISGGLQNAFQNPAQEAFLQMAGVNYWQQRQGFTPHNVQAIMAAATKQYGTGITRDMALRSMFGLQGADLLEQFSPGSRGAHLLQQNLAHGGSPQDLLHQIHHAQQRSTPQGTANRFGADILKWLEASPLHALLGAAGLMGGPSLLRGGMRLAGRGASGLWSRVFGSGGGALADEAGGGALSSILESTVLRGALGGIGGGIGGPLLFPDSISSFHAKPGSIEQGAVANVIHMAQKKFGKRGLQTMGARNWMEAQLYGPYSMDVWGAGSAETAGGFKSSKYRGAAGQLLDKLLGDQYAPGHQDPITKLDQAADKLLKLADQWGRGGKAPTSKETSYMGTPAIQAMGAAAPGMEFAALSGVVGGFRFVDNLVGAGGGGPAGTTSSNFVGTGGGGGQSCLLTWYDPALGGDNGGGQYADGGTYHTTDMACAAPPQYPFGTIVQFSYNGKTINCTVRDRGGAIQGSHFDLTRGAFAQLANLSTGTIHATFRVISQGRGKGGGGGGTVSAGNTGNVWGSAGAHAAPAPGGSLASAGGHPLLAHDAARGVPFAHVAHRQPLHVHVHVDGRKQRAQRILLGHHS